MYLVFEPEKLVSVLKQSKLLLNYSWEMIFSSNWRTQFYTVWRTKFSLSRVCSFMAFSILHIVRSGWERIIPPLNICLFTINYFFLFFCSFEISFFLAIACFFLLKVLEEWLLTLSFWGFEFQFHYLKRLVVRIL